MLSFTTNSTQHKQQTIWQATAQTTYMINTKHFSNLVAIQFPVRFVFRVSDTIIIIIPGQFSVIYPLEARGSDLSLPYLALCLLKSDSVKPGRVRNWAEPLLCN